MRISRGRGPRLLALATTATVVLTTTVAGLADLPDGPAMTEQVLRGRQLVIQNDCGGCHNRGNPDAVHDPSDAKWLSGLAQGAAGFVELG